jgi:hypothetical protein
MKLSQLCRKEIRLQDIAGFMEGKQTKYGIDRKENNTYQSFYRNMFQQ